MGKLKGEALKFAAAHMTSCRKHGYKKYRVLVCADSNKDGKTLCTYLQEAYSPSNIADYSGGYRDFSLVFDTVSRRDEVVDDINKAVNAYRDANPGIAPETSPPENPVVDDPLDDQTKSPSWTTYIVIGAAAVVILLLLWDRKK